MIRANLALALRLGLVFGGVAALGGCTRQAAPITPVSQAAAPVAATYNRIPAPITGIALPRPTNPVAIGYEVHGTGQMIVPPTQAAKISPGNRHGVTFDFVNANIADVVHTIFGEVLKENYTIDGGVHGKITLQTTRPLPRSAVIPALETSLQMAKLALTREADGYHIVPLAVAAQAGAGNLSVAGGPQTPGYGYEVIPLRYANAAEVDKLIQPLVQPGVQIQVDAARNLLIVAGTTQERAAIADNVRLLDVDWLAGMSYALLPMHYASAASVAAEVDQIIGGKASPLNGVVRLIVISQLNAILVITPQDRYLSQVKGWIRRLDQQQASDARQVFVYHVQNGRAADIAGILNKLLGSANAAESSAPPASGQPGSGMASQVSPLAPQPNGLSAQSSPASALLAPTLYGGQGAQGTMPSDPTSSAQGGIDNSDSGQSPRITADNANNSLLIYATPDQYRSLQRAIVELDTQPQQVMIEAVVAEVTLTNELRYGIQYFFQSGRVQSINTLGTAGAIAQQFPGFSAILAPGQNIQFALNALSDLTHVNVISAPKLLVLNNQPAELQVGDDVPIVTQSAQSTVTTGAPLVNTIEYRQTGVILHVTPRINAGGLVTLDISQEVSDVSKTTTSTLDSPTITERKISTVVAVPNGQTVALGGIIQSNTTTDNSGIPILRHIPVLGFLFSNHDTSGTRTELLIMLTPHVVQSVSSIQAMTDDLRRELPDVQWR
ncbi:type II secretion system secretin GspD [Acidiphilium iwatense]|uniref:Type II secretion system secretin GspD n=1 Tax=Acidiphilium iwatense TaxID=768198 RepID=A0ABS9DSS3_9PROT|nr:type II secretion system secretin GspD [Acidiphilium iwatense]MCF3945778.1 type II secretion system secretin GspD [Acidiphilium iwatense]